MADETVTRAKAASSIPPKAKGLMHVIGAAGCVLIALAPWLAIGLGSEVDPAFAVGTSSSAVSLLALLLGKRLGPSLIPLGAGAGGALATELLRVVGGFAAIVAIVAAGSFAAGCGGSAQSGACRYADVARNVCHAACDHAAEAVCRRQRE